MYHEYAPCYNSNAGTIEDQEDDVGVDADNDDFQLIRGTMESRRQSTSESGHSTLPLYNYFDTEWVNFMTVDQRKNLDVLDWWKNFNHQPVLQAMARDLLTPPASTVASESCFSASTRVLNDRRHNLSKTTLEMCVLMKIGLMQTGEIRDKKLKIKTLKK
jgi:hypothetical protein